MTAGKSATPRKSSQAIDAAAPERRPLEEREREEARQRAQQREAARAAGAMPERGVYTGLARASIAARAFAALADGVRDYAVFLMNAHGVITFWGESARLIKWWSRDQAEGAHLRLLYPAGGSDDGTAEAHLVQAARDGEYTGEGHRLRADGSLFWAGVTLTALRDNKGVLLGFAKVTRDLTARRAADALLQSAADSAERARTAAVAANAAKSGFLAAISHEIRTPVNAILGYHQLLEMGIAGRLSAGQQDYITRASASGRHLLSLITQVLDFSKLDAGDVPVEATPFRIGGLVRDAIDLVVPQAHERGIALINAVSGMASDLTAHGEEAGARQVLVNLLSNAVKFTSPDEGRPATVRVSAGSVARPPDDVQLEGPGPWVYLRVEDTGVGIPGGKFDSMFEPFVQGDMTLTRVPGGTGLGLAISRRIARRMQGEVSGHSEEGVGSTFILWLAAAPHTAFDPATRDTPPPSLRLEHGSLRALGDVILDEIDAVLQSFALRLREDPGVPSAQRLDEAQLADHLASFLADLAATLTSCEAGPDSTTASMSDGSAIQRLVARRHGMQRARLGWQADEVQREFVVLREELHAMAARRDWTGTHHIGGRQMLALLDQFIIAFERVSLASFLEAQQTVEHVADTPR